MKITVKDIRPNPFRKMKSYPISREKVEDLKFKIQKTFLWSGIEARPHPTKEGLYQIAFGHHRLIAIRELKIKEVDISVHDINNNDMIIMMADENLNQDPSIAVMNETVYAVQDYIKGELKKYKTLKEAKEKINDLINLLGRDWREEDFKKRNEDLGQTTILRFLNGGKKDGNWKQTMIGDALALKQEDKDGDVDKEAVEQLEKPYQARQFRKAVKDYHIPKEEQKKLAKKIKKHKTGGREIPKVVRKSAKKKPVVDPALVRLEKTFDAIDQYATALKTKIVGFRMQMKDLNVTQIKGAKAFIILTSLLQLRKEIDDLLNIKQTKQIKGKIK